MQSPGFAPAPRAHPAASVHERRQWRQERPKPRISTRCAGPWLNSLVDELRIHATGPVSLSDLELAVRLFRADDHVLLAAVAALGIAVGLVVRRSHHVDEGGD